MTSNETAVKFLNNPEIAPVLALANVTPSGVSVSTYLMQAETGLPDGSWSVGDGRETQKRPGARDGRIG
jgi:hypothetical protein